MTTGAYITTAVRPVGRRAHPEAAQTSVVPVEGRGRLSGERWLGGPEQYDAETIGIMHDEPVGVRLVQALVMHPVAGKPFFGLVEIGGGGHLPGKTRHSGFLKGGPGAHAGLAEDERVGGGVTRVGEQGEVIVCSL